MHLCQQVIIKSERIRFYSRFFLFRRLTLLPFASCSFFLYFYAHRLLFVDATHAQMTLMEIGDEPHRCGDKFKQNALKILRRYSSINRTSTQTAHAFASIRTHSHTRIVLTCRFIATSMISLITNFYKRNNESERIKCDNDERQQHMTSSNKAKRSDPKQKKMEEKTISVADRCARKGQSCERKLQTFVDRKNFQFSADGKRN